MGRHGDAGKTRRGSTAGRGGEPGGQIGWAGPESGRAKGSTGGRGGAGVVRPAADVPLRDVAAGTATRFHILVGPEDGAPNFVLRRFIMEEGGGMPVHTNEVEHEQYVLRGRARIRVGDRIHEVGPDHTLFIPAGTPHSYEVLEAPFEFICVVPNAPDRITLAEGEGC